MHHFKIVSNSLADAFSLQRLALVFKLFDRFFAVDFDLFYGSLKSLLPHCIVRGRIDRSIANLVDQCPRNRLEFIYLFDFITEELGDVFSDKQKVGMSDVFLASDYMSFKGAISFSDLPATTKVHIGRIHNYTNCSKERYVELCFDDELDKIPTSNKKDHKTPDYLSRKDDDHPDIAIEVYGTTQGELYQRCEGAVRHGDEKLIGWSEFTRQYCVDDDALKIAALVVDDYLLDNVDDNFLRRHISRIKVDGSQMDFLLIVFKDVASVSEIRAVIIALGDKEVPYNISERVEHWPHPYKIVSN